MASSSGRKRRLIVAENEINTKIQKLSSVCKDCVENEILMKKRRKENIDEVLETVEKKCPLYKEVVKKFLDEQLYNGPLIPQPISISTELVCDIFLNLERNELEKCQLISRSWKNIIEQHTDYLPLYSFFKLSIDKITAASDHNSIVQCCIETTSNRMILALTYKPHEVESKRVSAMKNYLRALKTVVFQCVELRRLSDRIERSMERDVILVEFMDLLKEFVRTEIRVVYCPLFIGYVSDVTDLFLKNYIKAHNVNIPFDNFFILNYTKNTIDYDNYTKKIKIFVDPDDYPLTEEKPLLEVLFDFVKECKVSKPSLYRICINSGWVSQPEFFDQWIEFYEKLDDQDRLINRFYFYNRRRFLDARFNTFVSLLIGLCVSLKKRVLSTYKKGYHYLFYTYSVRKLKNHILKVQFQFDLDAFETTRYDQFQEFVENQKEPNIERLELSYFRKIKFFVDND